MIPHLKFEKPFSDWASGTESILYAGMIGTVFFFVFSGITITTRLSVLGNDGDLVGRTHEVIQTIDELSGSIRDSETSMRGYVITGDETFLIPGITARPLTDASLAKLESLTKDAPAEAVYVHGARQAILDHERFVEHVLALARSQGIQSAADLIRDGEGEKLIESLRESFREMKDLEEELLKKRLARFEKTRIESKVIALVTILIVIALTTLTRFLDIKFRDVRKSLVIESNKRREADEALRFSQERLETALRDRALRVYSVDRDLRYVWMHDPENKQGVNLNIGKRDDEIFEGPGVEELVTIQAQVIESEESVRKVLVLPFKGENTTYDVTVEPNRSDSGEVIGATVSAFDIQTQIDYQLSLRESADEFRMLADAVPQLVWSAGEDAVTDYYNNRWFEYTGIDPNNNTTIIRQTLIHPDDRSLAINSWEEAVRKKTPYEYEYRIKNAKTGEYRWFIARAIPLFASDGRIIRWFGTSTDIEEQKRLASHNERLLESERSAREELQKSLAAKDEYVAALSHELRGPLNSILGWTQILRKKSEDPKLVSRGIDVIDRNARIQSQLVSDLFDMHRISAGKLTLETEDIYLTDLVESAADTILPICQEKHVNLIRNIQSGVSNVPGEGRRITQVLLNLLNNAVKFTPAGGRIELTLRTKENAAVIEVKDTGAGISAESISGIFDRYNQGNSRSDRKKGGLGLGLAIAKSFVEMHRGTIEVSSDGVGKGSIFRITLPRGRHLERSPDIFASTALNSRVDMADLSGLVVFVVEDQDDAREATTRILAEHGANAVGCSSALEALEKLGISKPDLVVSDISMPGMDGYALMREIKRIAPMLPGIALTAFSRVEDKVRATESGFSIHMTKPLEATKLVTAIYSLTKDPTSRARTL